MDRLGHHRHLRASPKMAEFCRMYNRVVDESLRAYVRAIISTYRQDLERKVRDYEKTAHAMLEPARSAAKTAREAEALFQTCEQFE